MRGVSVGSDVVVLCYHAVSEGWPTEYSVTPGQLDRQVAGLLARGYRPETASGACAASPGDRVLAVTFDDGLVSVLQQGLPVLERLGVPATVFACTGSVGRPEPMPIGYDRWLGGPYERELVSLSWDELAVLRDAGWEIGSHTRSHPHLTRLDDVRLEDELAESRADIRAQLGVPCPTLAYPAGDVDDRVAAAAQRAGYTAAFTAAAGIRAPSPWLTPRVVVLRSDGPSRFMLKTSRAGRRIRGASALWRIFGPGYRMTGGGSGHRAPG